MIEQEDIDNDIQRDFTLWFKFLAKGIPLEEYPG